MTRTLSALIGVGLVLAACDGTLGGLDDGGTGGGSAGGGGSTTIHYLGRFDWSAPGVARFEWSGSGFFARFQGTGVSASLGGVGGKLAVIIDDGAPVVVTSDGTEGVVSLASGLAQGEHRVELYRRPEASLGEMRFGGLTVSGGTLVASPPPFARRIEFIGDSITAGYGNEGADKSCSFSYATENEHLTYAAIAARELLAEHHTIAWSGIGMYRAYGETTSTNQMPVLYERTLPSQAGSQWDFTQWIPDVVVIDLGTNDFSKGDPGAPYVAAYLDFVVKLRGRYPQAHVFCAIGPMENSSAFKTAVQTIVSTRNTAGDPLVHFLEFVNQDGSLGYGCDWHPSLATHRQMAGTLVPAIKTVTGW